MLRPTNCRAKGATRASVAAPTTGTRQRSGRESRANSRARLPSARPSPRAAPHRTIRERQQLRPRPTARAIAADGAFSRSRAEREQVQVELQPQAGPRYQTEAGEMNIAARRRDNCRGLRALRSVGLSSRQAESNRAASVHHTPEVITGEFGNAAPQPRPEGKLLISLSNPARSTSAVERARVCKRKATHGGNRAQHPA